MRRRRRSRSSRARRTPSGRAERGMRPAPGAGPVRAPNRRWGPVGSPLAGGPLGEGPRAIARRRIRLWVVPSLTLDPTPTARGASAVTCRTWRGGHRPTGGGSGRGDGAMSRDLRWRSRLPDGSRYDHRSFERGFRKGPAIPTLAARVSFREARRPGGEQRTRGPARIWSMGSSSRRGRAGSVGEREQGSGDRPAVPGDRRGGKGIWSAGTSAIVDAFGVARRAVGLRGSRGRAGYNCCEYCGRPLPRDPIQTWRYVSTCAACGRDQY
jgi:hypothetical protein